MARKNGSPLGNPPQKNKTRVYLLGPALKIPRGVLFLGGSIFWIFDFFQRSVRDFAKNGHFFPSGAFGAHKNWGVYFWIFAENGQGGSYFGGGVYLLGGSYFFGGLVNFDDPNVYRNGPPWRKLQILVKTSTLCGRRDSEQPSFSKKHTFPKVPI